MDKKETINTKKEKLDFISLTAHQLKRPLSSIKLSLEMLYKGNFGRISKEQKDVIEKILQRSKGLIYLVNDLLDMAKIEERGLVNNLIQVDIVELIEFILEFEMNEITNKKIKFKFEKTYNSIKVKIDKEKISMAIRNVIDNAVKYTPTRGKITISLDKNGENLEIKIQDSGIGIPDNQKEKIFGKFFRADNAIEMESSGSGLGLFIARHIIESHKGKIWFESKEGIGTTFFIHLPIGS